MSDYEKQAEDFLKRCNASINVKFIGCMPNELWNDKRNRNVYSVRITTPRGKMNFKFWDSIYNTEKGESKPDDYSILACMETYDPGSFDDFCSEFGYDNDSIKARKIYRLCLDQYKDLCRIFTEEQMEELAEIQ